MSGIRGFTDALLAAAVIPSRSTTEEIMGFILGSSLAFSVGSVFMKASKGFTRPGPSLIVAVCFVLGAFLIARAVTTSALSTAIIVGLGFEAVLTLALGVLLVGDHISPVQGVGIAMVIGGVALVRIS